MKKYFQFIKYGLVAGISLLVDWALFEVLNRFVFTGILALHQNLSVTLAQYLAWIFSSLFNFACNRFVVFGHKGRVLPAMLQYYALAGSVLLLRLGMLNLLVLFLPDTVAYLIAQATLYLFNYAVQNKFIFAKKKQTKEEMT